MPALEAMGMRQPDGRFRRYGRLPPPLCESRQRDLGARRRRSGGGRGGSLGNRGGPHGWAEVRPVSERREETALRFTRDAVREAGRYD